MTASPIIRHQRAAVALSSEIFQYCKTHGGEVFASPIDAYFTDTDVVEPDVVFVRPSPARPWVFTCSVATTVTDSSRTPGTCL